MSGRLGRLQDVLLPAVATALALVLLAAVAVAALRSPTASAATVLVRGADVVAELPGGERVALAEGEEVPPGAVVTAGRNGAVLRTRDRDTWLSAAAQVQVRDGARQDLRAGFVMVDARRGPELALSTPAGTVTTPRGAVARVERGAVLRVGAYAGDAVEVRAVGRRASTSVGRARQVQVPVRGLPGEVTPLVLTPGDAYERALAADLVMADEALTGVARQIDTAGRPQGVVVAALSSDVGAAAQAVSGPVSERALAYLLALAADDDADLRSRYATVRQLRGQGGSWGPVADLVGAPVERVAGVLDELLGTPAVLVADEVDVVDLLTGGGPAPAPTAAPTPPAPRAPGASAPPAPTPSQPVEPAPPTTSPSPSPDVLDTVVDTVNDLLPPAPVAPVTGSGGVLPLPLPTSSGGAVGGLLP